MKQEWRSPFTGKRGGIDAGLRSQGDSGELFFLQRFVDGHKIDQFPACEGLLSADLFCNLWPITCARTKF